MRQSRYSFKRAIVLLVVVALAVMMVGPSARAQDPASDSVGVAAAAGGSGGTAYGAATGAPANSVFVAANGRVGIGNQAPGGTLDVTGNIVIANTFPAGSPGLPTLNVSQQAGGLVGRFISSGTGASLLLKDAGTNQGVQLRSQGGNFSVLVSGGTPALNVTSGGLVGINTTAPQAGSVLDVAGTTRTNVLVIDAGGDLAEPFDINSTVTIEPGMVVAIDPDNPGQLRLADAAYDHTVAGVVSGAGGINPGLILQQEGSIAAGEHPVALTGRVYVHADASNGAIQPGDLLTTSATPGHAMKVTDHAQAQGAILGKAMSKLDKGTGLVLVLVTLQ